ncbi:hypothetical protein M4578_25390 [Salipiger sp. P9]|uniref:hypothetical protein n=1 Tax=Salipiger pentaromativorans TaxID=2943193 RepID=UPI0021584CBE|nr:hypothetical protein [Salipiger pentaromativorans]MCR8551164.1 hypothetical protein [Salipiger pentaromativorans]
MAKHHHRVLAVAARSGRLGAVVLDSGRLVFWTTSRKASLSSAAAAAKLRDWLAEFQPDVLVTENPDTAGRKKGRQIAILRAFLEVGQDAKLVNLAVRRVRRFENAYAEAASFVARFPDLQQLRPEKPPIWGKEPYTLVCFDALVLIREAGLLGPATEPV